MKVMIEMTGDLVITPQNALEKYALDHWLKDYAERRVTLMVSNGIDDDSVKVVAIRDNTVD